MKKHIEKVFEIYEKQYEQLLRRAVSILGNLQDAEDVMQELAITIMKKEDIFKDIGNIKAYLSTATRNLAIDKYRKNKSLSNSVMNGELQDGFHVVDKNEFAEIEFKDFIDKLLAPYPKEIREAFIKYVLDGYTINELAKEIGISANSLSQKIKRMKKHITKRSLLFMVFLIIIRKSLS